MVMTPAEIVAEYKQAKSPLKQIKILADQNVCKTKDIVEILRDAKCYIPSQYMPKVPKPVIETPEVPKQVAAVEPWKVIAHVKVTALSVIDDLMTELDCNDIDVYAFVERVRGVLKLAREVQ